MESYVISHAHIYHSNVSVVLYSQIVHYIVKLSHLLALFMFIYIYVADTEPIFSLTFVTLLHFQLAHFFLFYWLFQITQNNTRKNTQNIFSLYPVKSQYKRWGYFAAVLMCFYVTILINMIPLCFFLIFFSFHFLWLFWMLKINILQIKEIQRLSYFNNKKDYHNLWESNFYSVISWHYQSNIDWMNNRKDGCS